MKEIFKVSASDLLKGKVKPEDLTPKYVFLYNNWFGILPWGKLAKAMNFLVKYGWRAVGYSKGAILIERED